MCIRDSTSTEYAAWTLVEGDDKPYARIKVLRILRDTLKAALARELDGTGSRIPCGVKQS